MDSAPPAAPPVRALRQAREAQGDVLVIGIVGAVGAGTSWTARVLRRLLERRGVAAAIVTAQDALGQVADHRPADPIAVAERLQAAGDGLRERHDNAIVASGMVARIAALWDAAGAGRAPPGVVLCDSLRHPDEARLLRMVYGDAFWLLGTVCDLDIRRARLTAKFTGPDGAPPEPARLRAFIERDQEDSHRPHGQQVSATFEIADYFVDTSPPLRDPAAPDAELDAWPVARDLGRFLTLIGGERHMLRPTDAERAMDHAYAARLGSACLSRQVGAALIDRSGQLLATGCNEVPRAGGGLYGQGEGEEDDREWGRCHRLNGFCSNTVERNLILDDVLRLLGETGIAVPPPGPARDGLRNRLRRSRLGTIIEFSRSVHAEMDVLVSAARKGVSTVGGRLFVTTFPCHNCARHIVAAGIDEVQFIEPYLKSKALTLHADAIAATAAPGSLPPSVARARGAGGRPKVLFHPYVGAAPRLYRQAFAKPGEVKDGTTGSLLPAAAPGAPVPKPLARGFEPLQREIAARFAAATATAGFDETVA